MNYQWRDAEVMDVLNETPVVKRFILKIKQENIYEFHAGQFVMLNLPIQDKVTTRAYSIASPPTVNNIIELVISLNPVGLGTHYLFHEIQPGHFLSISQPLGKFNLPRPSELKDTLCFICTGTGIAPFRSMLLDLLNHNIPHKTIYLIFGCRTQEDLLFRSDLEQLHKRMPDFHYFPVLSRAQNENWQGEKGYVHQVYKRLFSLKQPALFYICGWHEMVMQAKEELLKMGYAKDHIKMELYD